MDSNQFEVDKGCQFHRMRFFLVSVVQLEKIHEQGIYLCRERRHELASRDGNLVQPDDTGYVAFGALEQLFMEI